MRVKKLDFKPLLGRARNLTYSPTKEIRFTLRIPDDVMDLIDEVISKETGYTSRNTLILKAIRYYLFSRNVAENQQSIAIDQGAIDPPSFQVTEAWIKDLV